MVPRKEENVLTGATIVRTFKMKKGTEVPDKFDGAEIRITLASPADTIEQATANMLACVAGETEADRANALLDTFNSAHALDAQKTVKAAATEDSTVEQLQAVSDTHRSTRNQRGGGGGVVKQKQKEKATKFDQVADAARQARENLIALRETDPATYNAQLTLMQSLMPETVADLELVS